MKRLKNNLQTILLITGSMLGIVLSCDSGVIQRTVSAEETAVTQSAAPTKTESPDVINSPYIGENGVYAEWTYDEPTRCLTIRGNGETHSEKSADYRNSDGFDKFATQYIPGLKGSGGNLKVKEIKILDGVTSIGSAAFAYYRYLEKITIPDSVQSIGNYVFYECESLKEISIPDGVQSIGKECFFGCTALKKISFGKNVSNLGDAVFWDCMSLSQLTVSVGNPYFSVKEGILYNTAQKTLYVSYADNSEKLTIDTSINKISAGAFAKNKKLKTVKIPASVTEIGGAAFYKCTNLTKVSFAVKSKCKIIKDYTWWDGDEQQHYGSFQGCKKLKQMIFPNSLQYIDDMCMKGCSNLQKVHFGKAFKGVKGESDSEMIFGDYKISVQIYSISKGNKKFSSKNGVLYNKKKTRLLYYPSAKKQKKFRLPRSVTSIKYYAFYRCKKLKGLVIARKNAKLEEDVFCKCGRITIYGKKNSTAQDYAELNGMKFVMIK